MEIKTKYSIGDKIFFLFENRVQQSVVEKINVELSEPSVIDSGISIYYKVPFNDVMSDLQLRENKVYDSKEELIASL